MKNRCITSKLSSLVTDKLKGMTFQVGGSLASKYNNQLIYEAIIPWLLVPIENAETRNSINTYYCNVGHLLKFISETDFTITLELLAKGYSTIIKDCSYDTFKACYPRATVALISPLQHILSGWFSERKDYGCLRLACTYLRFLSKLRFQRDELEAKALDSFLDSEKRMRELCLDGNPYLDDLHSIIFEWVSPWRGNLLPVRHGTGSVAEGSLTKVDKYLNMSVDTLLLRHLKTKYDDPSIYFPFPHIYDNKLTRCSRVKFVPKSATKLRTICMEPITLQYFQQGIMRLMYHYIDHHNYLSQHIQLGDQTQNQQGAKLGSNTDKYCTLDLSAASDSVSWQLVRRLFKGTSYLTWCHVTRSTHNMLPDGTTIESYKFAPMGSALCFPTECLIFCAVVELVARKHSLNNSNYIYYSIYGDDIVCPSCWADEVISVLSSIGFVINNEKSFINGPFRESCGKEYYLGRDITPQYYRCDVMNGVLNPTSYEQVCAAANNAAEGGLLYLRSYYIDIVLNYRKKGLPKGYPDSPLFTGDLGCSPRIFSDNPTNFHLKSRHSCSLNAREYTYLGTSTRVEEAPSVCVSDTITYHEWLIEREFYRVREQSEAFSKKYGRTRLIWNKARATNTFNNI